jgi:hypothetical protein
MHHGSLCTTVPVLASPRRQGSLPNTGPGEAEPVIGLRPLVIPRRVAWLDALSEMRSIRSRASESANGGAEDRTLRARDKTDNPEGVQGWWAAASMCSERAALRSEGMALFERKFVD